MPLSAEWQGIANLTVTDGGRPVPIPETFDGASGGDTTSAARSYRAGGGVEPEVYTAPSVTEDITLERAYRPERDGAWRRWLAKRVNYQCSLTVADIGADRRAITDTQETIRGVIKSVSRPAFRSEGDTVRTYRVVITPNGHWA